MFKNRLLQQCQHIKPILSFGQKPDIILARFGSNDSFKTGSTASDGLQLLIGDASGASFSDASHWGIARGVGITRGDAGGHMGAGAEASTSKRSSLYAGMGAMLQGRPISLTFQA